MPLSSLLYPSMQITWPWPQVDRLCHDLIILRHKETSVITDTGLYRSHGWVSMDIAENFFLLSSPVMVWHCVIRPGHGLALCYQARSQPGIVLSGPVTAWHCVIRSGHGLALCYQVRSQPGIVLSGPVMAWHCVQYTILLGKKNLILFHYSIFVCAT